jgi:hypothetical protein
VKVSKKGLSALLGGAVLATALVGAPGAASAAPVTRAPNVASAPASSGALENAAQSNSAYAAAAEGNAESTAVSVRPAAIGGVVKAAKAVGQVGKAAWTAGTKVANNKWVTRATSVANAVSYGTLAYTAYQHLAGHRGKVSAPSSDSAAAFD